MCLLALQKKRFCCDLSQRIITEDVTGRQRIRRFYWEWKNFKRHIEVVFIKLQSVVVADGNEVCGTYNRKQTNLLYRGVKLLSTNSAIWEVQPFCCQRLHGSVRSTEDAKIFLVVRRGWQVSDQLTVSHRRSSRMRGTWRHLVRRDNESTSTVKSQRSHHSSAMHMLAFFL